MIDPLRCENGRHAWRAHEEGLVWCQCGEHLAKVTFGDGRYRIELVDPAKLTVFSTPDAQQPPVETGG